MEFERHRRWNIFSLALVVTLLSLVMLPAVNSQENETNSSLPYIDPLVSQEVNQHGWALSLVTVNNSSSVDVVMSGLPPSSFVLIQQYPENSSFSANISWQAFDILANDTNVTSIYLWINDTINQTNQTNQTAPLITKKVIEELNESEWVKIGAFVETAEALELILAELNESEFQLKKISYEYQPSFSGNISRSGFEKLRYNPNITRILSGNFTVSGTGKDEIEPIEKIDEKPSANISNKEDKENKKQEFFKSSFSGGILIALLIVLILSIVVLNKLKMRSTKT